MKLFFKLTLLVIFVSLTACGGKKAENSNESSEAEIAIAKQNEATVKAVCGSCHKFIPAEYLDKSAWANVIPVMAAKMGIFEHNGETYFNEKLYLIWGIFTSIWGIFQWPPVWEGLGDSMKTVNNELARESLGLLICSFIAILQYVIIIRKRIS